MQDSLTQIKKAEEKTEKELEEVRAEFKKEMIERENFWKKKRDSVFKNHDKSLELIKEKAEVDWKEREKKILREHEERVKKIKNNYKKNIKFLSKSIIDDLL